MRLSFTFAKVVWIWEIARYKTRYFFVTLILCVMYKFRVFCNALYNESG